LKLSFSSAFPHAQGPPLLGLPNVPGVATNRHANYHCPSPLLLLFFSSSSLGSVQIEALPCPYQHVKEDDEFRVE